MRIIIGCEESQTICKEFRKFGHEAYSCDLIECSGGHPEWHLQGNVLDYLEQDWQMGIFHPPCTFIANSGARWLFEKEGRWKQLDEACEFFKKLLFAPIEKICVENPLPHKWGLEKIGIKYSQKVQPYYFGDKQKKGTCLWLKNLPMLIPTTPDLKPPKDKTELKKWEMIWRMPPSADQKRLRSKTFTGMAKAIAEQWGSVSVSSFCGEEKK